MRGVLNALVASAAGIVIAGAAQATTFSFVHISAQGGDAPNSGFASQTAQQLFVDITDEGGGQVRFTFRNEGPLASSIQAIYFDDGHLLGIASIVNGPGTEFSQGASPGDLPGGNTLTIPFNVTVGFLASADNPAPSKGVNPGQWVAIVFSLINGATYQDVIDDMGNGSLRIGMHVIGQADGDSDAFINNGDDTPVVPLPAGAGLALAGLAPLALRRRRTL